jgi:hypothetical protein
MSRNGECWLTSWFATQPPSLEKSQGNKTAVRNIPSLVGKKLANLVIPVVGSRNAG